MTIAELKKIITNIPDFPIPGIQFKDINPLLTHPEAFQTIVNTFADFVKKQGATAVLAPEARGFIFSAAVAYKLGIKLILARKKGKLPGKVFTVNYDLEYGSTSLQMVATALDKNDKVIIIDDLIATAGTIHACLELVTQAQAKTVGIATLISLTEFAQHHNFAPIAFLQIIKF